MISPCSYLRFYTDCAMTHSYSTDDLGPDWSLASHDWSLPYKLVSINSIFTLVENYMPTIIVTVMMNMNFSRSGTNMITGT